MLNHFELKWVDIPNGERLGYRECGQGNKTILLIHGNMSSSKHWDIVMDELKDEYKIYAVDMRGFGASTYNKEINSLKDFAEDINYFVNAMDIKEYAAVGWSTGGGVALELAVLDTRVRSIVLVESVGIKGYPMFIKDATGMATSELIRTREQIAADAVQVAPVLKALDTKNKEFYRYLWDVAIYTKNKPSEEKYEEYLDDMLTQRNLVDVDYALVHFNMTDEHNGIVEGSDTAKDIKIPVLILQGDRDYVVPMYMAEDLHKHLSNSEIRILNDCGHSPLIDSFKELINSIKELA